MKINKKNGFTLIELLVVIVIIGILAGIGIAQFKDQQKKAKYAKRIAEKSQSCKQSVASCVESQNTACETFASCMDSNPVALTNNFSISLPFDPLTLDVKKITFDLEIKDDNFVLFNANGAPYYFFAAHAVNPLYYYLAINNPAYLRAPRLKVDGATATDLRPLFNDGEVHSYEITNFNFTGWNNIILNGKGGASDLSGDISNLKFWDGTDALIASYSFSDGSGTTITDGSGNGHSGTLSASDLDAFWGN